MSSNRSVLLAVTLGVVLVAGCATTVAGTAEPNGAAVSALASSTPTTSSEATSRSSETTASTTPEATTPEATTPSQSSESSATTEAPTGSTQSTASTGNSTSSTVTSSRTASTSGDSVPKTYPTTPAVYPKTPATAEQANLLEGRRIAGSLVVPTFIDESYTKGGNLSTLPFKGPRTLSILFSSPAIPTIAERAGMLTGFSSARSDKAGNALLVAAFEFGTAAQAAAAAPVLVAAVSDKKNDKGKAVVPGYPASAGWYGTLTDPYFQSFLAQGAMVLYLYVSGPKLKTPALQAALAAKTFAVQSASMAKFVPTAPDKLLQLPVDPDGLLGYAIPDAPKDATVRNGVLGPAGELHYDTDPVGTRSVFGNAGVDVVVSNRATIYRAADNTGAMLVQADFIGFVQRTEASWQPYELTAAVEDAKCLLQPLNSVYYCVGTHGRFAYELTAQSEQDINAVMTAHDALLAKL